MNFYNNVVISSLKDSLIIEVIDMQLSASTFLGSEHTFKHTVEFLQSSFSQPRVAAQVLILQTMRLSALSSGNFF